MMPSADCGLYVHIPFCETKCGYCDFFSVPLRGRRTAPLVERVCRELGIRVPGQRIRTVFCGGGTPTLLPLPELDHLLTVIGELVPLQQLEEFTVEANPATVDKAKATLLASKGVSRVSMGAQSFFAEELATLERLHSPADIAPSVEILRAAGIRQLNLDLIFGIPGQSLSTWRESMDRAVEMGVDHIACYGLTYEPGTALAARRKLGAVVPCDEVLEIEMFTMTVEHLAAAGYAQYEISNFARPGRESRHNLIYWRNEPYLGVGPSAAGCVDSHRYKNVPDVGRYIRMIDTRGTAEQENEELDKRMQVLEAILMQLRLNEGLSAPRFYGRFGVHPNSMFASALPRLEGQGLVIVSESAIVLSPKGRLVANDVMAELAAAGDVWFERAVRCGGRVADLDPPPECEGASVSGAARALQSSMKPESIGETVPQR